MRRFLYHRTGGAQTRSIDVNKQRLSRKGGNLPHSVLDWICRVGAMAATDTLQPAISAEQAMLRMADPADLAEMPSDMPDAFPPASRPPAAAPASASRFGANLAKPLAGMAGQIREAVIEERELGAGFLAVPFLAGAGAITYFRLESEPHFAVLAAACLVLAVCAWLGRFRPLVHAACMTPFLLVLGMLAAKTETLRAGTMMLGSPLATMVTGRIAEIDLLPNGSKRLTLDVLSTERPALRHSPARVRVSARSLPEGTKAGDGVKGLVRLLPPTGPVRPGSFDFSFSAYFTRIGANGFFLAEPQITNAPSPGSVLDRMKAAAARMREGISARIRARLPGAEGEIAAALIAGAAAGISPAMNESMRRSGIAHVTSISGLHLALVAGLIMGTIRAAFALFPGFSQRRPVRKYAAAAALAGVSFYLLLSGAAVATQRSWLMITVMLLALMADRAAISMRNLGLAGLAIILVTPHELVGPSFQLSFAATAALVAGYGAFTHWQAARQPDRQVHPPLAKRALRWIGGALAGLALTSLLAGTATVIIGAWHFHRIAPLGLFANLAAMPIVSVIIMPAGMAAALLMPLGLEGPALDLMGWGISAMIAVSDWFAERSPLDAAGMVPDRAMLAYVLALACLTGLSTRLRLFGLPMAVLALVLWAVPGTPVLLVSEDGKLMAFRTADGGMAVNRMRPNTFTARNWQMAFNAGKIIKPEKPEPDQPAKSGPNEKTPTLGQFAGSVLMPAGKGRFACTGMVCAAEIRDGLFAIHAENPVSAAPWCDRAAIMVIADATAQNPCADPAMTVVTARHLALLGSAEISLPALPGQKPVLRQAFTEPLRPWSNHRRFSRAARGIPPWKPDPAKAKPSSETDPPQ